MLDLSDIVKQKETVKTDAEMAELKERVNSLHTEVMATKTEITKRNNTLFLFACVVLSLEIIYTEYYVGGLTYIKRINVLKQQYASILLNNTLRRINCEKRHI